MRSVDKRSLIPPLKLALSAVLLGCAFLNWKMRLLPERSILSGSGRSRVDHGESLRPGGPGDAPVPNADQAGSPRSHTQAPAVDVVPISPALRAELDMIQRALAESLEGRPPLPQRHARTLASWVSNLMLDAAYQDARYQGSVADPELAKAQVKQALLSRP
jgi:hypothetical protein